MHLPQPHRETLLHNPLHAYVERVRRSEGDEQVREDGVE